MKNIERPEVQERIASALGDYGTCDLCPFTVDEKICRDHKEWPCSKTIYEWFQQEYFEPHHWEPWELEVMKRFPKYITGLYNSDTETIVLVNGEKTNFITVDFPSLKLHETIDIDAELERNGMHR